MVSQPIPIVAPISEALADPIAEAPNAVWYVRPAAGGQFGPAGGEVMRQWIAQRRVGSDSLVWREGWPEWQRAAATFPSLALTTPPPLNAAAGAGRPAAMPIIPRMDDDWMEAIVEAKPAATAHHRPRSTKGNNLILAISAVIVLIGAIVAISLIVTAIRRNRRDSAPAPAPAATTMDVRVR